MNTTSNGVSDQFFDDGTDPRSFVSPDQARVGIVPVPLEKTVSYLAGTAGGPAAILEGSRQVELFDPEFGNSPFRAGIFTWPAVDCSGGIDGILSRIGDRVGALAATGRTPVCLGGEHTVTLAPVTVLQKQYPGLSILHLDAHADLRKSYGGGSLSHACVMRRIHELSVPSVSVGIRAISEEEAGFIAANNLSVYPDWKYAESGYPWKDIAAGLSPEVYITVDLDVFNPAEVPAVGTPEPGGLGWYNALSLFREVAASGRKVVGFDLVELCPREGEAVSPFFAARLLYKMIGFFCRD